MRFGFLPLLFVSFSYLQAQSVSGGAAPGSQPSSSGPAVAQPSVGTQTYTVEGDILGYRAIQSDGEAIACDVAGALVGTSPIVANGAGSKTSACAPSISLVSHRILVLTSSDQTLSNYQMWRVSLLMIDSLQRQATALIPAAAPAAPSTSSLSLTETAISSTLSLVQQVLGFFVSNESVTGIQGTPQDIAIANATARQLRVMGAQVIVPSLYSPYAFNGLNFTSSPFLSRLNTLETTRGQLAAALTDKTVWDTYNKKISDDTMQLAKLKSDDAANTAVHKPSVNSSEISRLSREIAALQAKADQLSSFYVSIGSISNAQLTAMILSIDTFSGSLLNAAPVSNTANAATPVTPAPGAAQATPAPATTPGGTGQISPAANTPTAQAAPAAANPTSPPVPPAASILLADGLARKLGATPANLDPDISQWVVLSIKEMEIGSTVVSRANIFGTKVSYAGGAVATYALFNMNGDEYCSANLFDYGGRLKGKDFDRQFRNNNIDPSKQLIFSRGSCSQTAR